MSAQLAVGTKLSLPGVRAAWLKYNNDNGRAIKVVYNTKAKNKKKAQYLNVCYTAPKDGWHSKPADVCSAHVHATGPSREEMTIVSCDLNHTCPRNNQRARNYRTSDIKEMSNILELYEPTATKEGNAKQLISMTKHATGVTMKVGQASLAIRAISHDSIEAQIGQYLWIPSLFKAYAEADPDGTYQYQSRQCRWNNNYRQFERCYVCISIAKHFWKHAGIDMKICDGTFTRLRSFKHVILIAVTFDGNNQVIILAFAIVDAENAANWVWFKERLEVDFPGCRVWMSDADKGITSRAFILSMSQDGDDAFVQSRCIRHLAGNAKENCNGKMNEDDKRLIVKLAKARTEDVYQDRLKEVKERNSQWATFLDNLKNQFSTVSFLNRGYMRHGKVTSNGVEVINNAINAARCLPIVYMIEAIVKYQRDKYNQRKVQANQWVEEGKQFTLFAENSDLDIGESAQKRDIEMVEENHPFYKARVSVGVHSSYTGQIEVWVNVLTHESGCPCRNKEETGAPCPHLKTLLLKLGLTEKEWYHIRYHAVTYKASYGCAIPAMTTMGKLEADETFIPPDHKASAGRPKKKRMSKNTMRKTSVRRTCKACGKLGHFAVGCEHPSTQYRVEENLTKAIKWCRCQEKKATDSLEWEHCPEEVVRDEEDFDDEEEE